MRNTRHVAVWLLTSAVALAAGGVLTRYVLATPDPDFFGPPVSRWYPIPTDPLGLAHKWLYAALAVGAVGGFLWLRSRHRIGSISVASAALLGGFWLALVGAVEFSGPEWAAAGWQEPRANVTPQMNADPHFLVYDSRSGGDAVHIIRIVPRELNTGVFMALAGSGSREARDPAREGLRATETRKTYAVVCWIGVAALAVGFFMVVRRTRAP